MKMSTMQLGMDKLLSAMPFDFGDHLEKTLK